MKYTENYGFDIPEGTDFVDVEHFNTNTEMIDKLLCPEYEAEKTLTELSSGEKLSTAFGKLAKAVKELISHLADKTIHITSAERTLWNTVSNKSDSNHTHNYAGSSSAGGAATSANKLNTIQLAKNADLDTLLDTDLTMYYASHNNTINNNPESPYGFNLKVYRSSGDFIVQELVSQQGNTYLRYYTGSSWTSWKQVAFTTDKVASAENDGEGNNIVKTYARKDRVVEHNDSELQAMFSSAGWYRVAKFHRGSLVDIQGAVANGCRLIIKRHYNSHNNEYHEVSLQNVFQHSRLTSVVDISNTQLITRVRHVVDETNGVAYLEVYYGGSATNNVSFMLCDAMTNYNGIPYVWGLMTPEATEEAADGVRVYFSMNIPANSKGEATQDGSGNVIADTYATKQDTSDISGNLTQAFANMATFNSNDFSGKIMQQNTYVSAVTTAKNLISRLTLKYNSLMLCQCFFNLTSSGPTTSEATFRVTVAGFLGYSGYRLPNNYKLDHTLYSPNGWVRITNEIEGTLYNNLLLISFQGGQTTAFDVNGILPLPVVEAH